MLYKEELFQGCSLQTYPSADAYRSWQTAYERTTSVINELTSVTSPDQIYWIYFLVHLWNWRDCKIDMACCGPACPTNSSCTGVSDSRGASSWSPVNSLTMQQVLRSLVSLTCQGCAELVGAASVWHSVGKGCISDAVNPLLEVLGRRDSCSEWMQFGAHTR